MVAVQRSKRILIVNGDANQVRVLKRSLAQWAVVETAENAASGLCRLEEFRFDAVVCDDELGDHDGLWLLKRIRARHPDVLRLLLSSRRPSAIEEHRVDLVQRYAAKPIVIEELLKQLDIVGGPRYEGSRI